MRKIKIGVLLSALVLLTTLSIFSVNAAGPFTVRVDQPVAGAVIHGVSNFTANVSVNTDEVTNCSFYVKSDSTGNSTWTLLNYTLNWTGPSSDIHFTTNISGVIVQDANDYTLNVTCCNISGGGVPGYCTDNTTVTNLIFDYTVPGTPSSLSPATDSKDTDGTVNFSASTFNATACTLWFTEGNPGYEYYNMTNSIGGTGCSYQLTSIPEQSYKWYVIATDGRNTSSASTTYRVAIDETTSAGKKALLEWAVQEGKLEKGPEGTYSVVGSFLNREIIPGVQNWILGVVVIIGLVLYLVFVRKR